MKRVNGHRYLFRRGDLFYFRRKVPGEAVEAFDRRREVLKSLGTGDLAEARHRLAIELASFETCLKASRGAFVSSTAQRIASSRLPSKPEIETRVRQWLLQRVARGGDELSSSVATTAHDLRRVETLRAHQSEVARGISLGAVQPSLTTEWVAQAIIEDAGWPIENGSAPWRHLVKLVARGQIEANSWLAQDIAGEPRVITDARFSSEQYALDEVQRASNQTPDPVSILALLESYISEAALAPATVKKWRRQVAAFVAFIGHDDATRIVLPDIVGWKERLLSEPNSGGRIVSARTVRDTYLAVLKSIFRWAVSNGKLPLDPTLGVQVAGKRKATARDRGLTDEEAAIILAATLAPPQGRLSRERSFAQRWIPWICAYTGARVNEISQLRGEDVMRQDGIWAILITPEAGSVKTGVARTVPLHPHLIEQGFVAAINGIEGPLFFDPARHRGGKDGNPQYKKVGEHLAKWVRELGVTRTTVWPDHGWRHRFKTQARLVGMDPETRDAIQGHAPRSEGEAYGEVPTELMFREIAKLPRYVVSGVSFPSSRNRRFSAIPAVN